LELPGHDDLLETYRQASDAALLDLALTYDTLTAPAQAALRSEFARRGLEPPVLPDAPPVAAYQRLVTVRQYRELAEAQVAKGALESAGVDCFLRDENAVRLEWVWSNLLGGVRLQVREEDKDAAEEILRQPIPEHIALSAEDSFEQPRCPRCGSLDIHFQGIHERLGMASIIALYPLPIPKRAWRCESCGAEWREEDGGAEG
jgi:Putative prokaryotic signal transducing protein